MLTRVLGKIQTVNLDRWGMSLSLLCAIHCLLTPFVILSVPLMARYYLAHPLFHVMLAVFIIPVGLLAFASGFKHHRNFLVYLLGVPGLFVVVVTPYFVHALHYRWNEPVIMTVGSFLLITAHWINRRSCSCEAHHH
jgi:hypothetical protein